MPLVSSSIDSMHSYQRKKLRYARSLNSNIPIFALNYQTTERIKSLSKPKIRQETTIRDGRKRISMMMMIVV